MLDSPRGSNEGYQALAGWPWAQGPSRQGHLSSVQRISLTGQEEKALRGWPIPSAASNVLSALLEASPAPFPRTPPTSLRFAKTC